MIARKGIGAALGKIMGPAPVDLIRRGWYGLKRLDPRLGHLHREFVLANRGLEGTEMLLRPSLRVSVDPEARPGFEHFCFRSLEMVRELDGFLAHSTNRFRLLDIGALHGLFALAFTHQRPSARALAIEPSPLAFPVLARNLETNLRGDQIQALNLAVGARRGSLAMRLDWHHLEACAPGDPQTPGDLQIELSTVDEICRERDFQPDVVKLDVEGYELEVLRGAEAVLARTGADLFLELHPSNLERLGASSSEVFDLLERMSYRVFDHRGRDVSRRQFSEGSQVRRYRCVTAHDSALLDRAKP